MKDRGYGRIVCFSSMSWRGDFGQANYVAAKAGIVGLTRAIALEGAKGGITANAIAPGLIETPMLASMNGPARDKLVGRVPLGRTGAPEDVAAAAAFLASEESGYITGVVLDVDGGIGIGSSIRRGSLMWVIERILISPAPAASRHRLPIELNAIHVVVTQLEEGQE